MKRTFYHSCNSCVQVSTIRTQGRLVDVYECGEGQSSFLVFRWGDHDAQHAWYKKRDSSLNLESEWPGDRALFEDTVQDWVDGVFVEDFVFGQRMIMEVS